MSRKPAQWFLSKGAGLLLVFSVFFSGCQSESRLAFNNNKTVRVIKVIDADTIVVEGPAQVRLLGIDAPEMRIRKGEDWQLSPQEYALEATEFTRELVLGQNVRLEFDNEKLDNYARTLAYCFLDNLMLNELLLENGLAVLYLKAPNLKYHDRLSWAEREARKAGKGIWSGIKTVSAQNAHLHIGQVCLVEGVVVETGESSQTFYLNFGQDYKTDFTVVIFKQNLPLFKSFLNDLKGKNVRVSGRIKEYNGPEIILNHPSQIELISLPVLPLGVN